MKAREYLFICIVLLLVMPPVFLASAFIFMDDPWAGHRVLYSVLISEMAILTCLGIVIFILHGRAVNETNSEIVNRRHAVEALRESERQLQDVINFLPDPTFVIDRGSNVVVWNHAMEELTGVQAGDMIGMGDHEYALPFYGERRPLLIDIFIEGHEVIEKYYPGAVEEEKRIFAEMFTPALGRYLWGISQPLYDSHGEIAGAIESIRDITDQRNRELTIRQQKERYEAVNRELSFTVMRMEEANREYEIAHSQLLDAQSKLVSAHEKLQESEEKFSAAFRLSPVVMSLSTADEGRYVEVSDQFFKLTGYTRDEVMGHTSIDLGIWVDTQDRDRVVKKLMEEGRVMEEEIRMYDKWKNIHIISFSAEFITVLQAHYLLSINMDITERKLAQDTIQQQKQELEKKNEELNLTIRQMDEANKQLVNARDELMKAHDLLRQSEEKYSMAFHLGPVIITLSTLPEGRYVEVSDHYLRLTEYVRDEVIGHTAIELGIWADLNDRQRIFELLRQGKSVIEEEIRFKSKSGKVYTMLYSAEVIMISQVPHLVSVAVDMTERRKAEQEKEKLEQQLLQSQKMESIGRLAGGVAHDFNNILTAILGNAELVMARGNLPEDIAARLATIKKAADSATQLTRQLLAFSRKQIIEPEVIDIRELIDRMEKMLVRMIGEDIGLSTVHNCKNGFVRADPAQIEQIIINLAVNARDAMPEGGRLVIETSDCYLDDEFCRTHDCPAPGQYVMTSISDTGSGLDREVMAHLFEPFFTTKPKGKGTGLGLAMVYGAVRQNKGVIDVSSVPGRGTTFRIYLPCSAEKGIPIPQETAVQRLPSGSETILIVEDDAMVLEYALSVLGRLGYRMLTASNGEDAIRVAEAHEGTIHILLTDVILPGMNGKILSENILQLRPGIRVLFTSGYTENLIARHGVLEDGIHFIGKPYTSQALARKVREVLDK